MALHVTHVHSPSDCDFCNRRTVGQSVPDLTLPLYGSSPPNRSLVPSPMRLPNLSPRTTKGPRARLSRQQRLHTRASYSLNAATSLELLSRRQVLKPEMSPRKASEDLQETPFRRRVYTMPTSRPMETSDSSDLYRLRSFSVTSRGSVLNLGDLMCFRSRSDFSTTSEGSRSSLDFRDRASSSGSMAHCDVPHCNVPHYRVLVMGNEGVGKTSLIAQFMTSEYLTVRNALSNECQDVTNENATVSILLDGKEADLDCIESRNLTLTKEEFSRADIILMTYSVTHDGSFRSAVHALTTLRDLANSQPVTCLPLGPGLRSKVVILVGNKADLARIRTVTTEVGRCAASKYDVKFIETSVTIHHNVDELLVGALSQLRLKARQAAALSCRRHAKLTTRAKDLWNRFVQKCDFRFKSCDNLHHL